MARTFDIRFDAAANSFGWRGGAQLSVDTQGLSFALKRGIASLLARRRSQRIPADRIIEVYREGDALRVEFATDDNPRVVLPFWARNRDAAAEIVQLLPTLRTFEVEHGPSPSSDKKARVPWAWPVTIVIVLAAAVWLLDQMRLPKHSITRPTTDSSRVETAPALPAIPPVSTAPPAPLEEASDWTQGSEPTPEQARRAAIFYGTPMPYPETASPVATTPRTEALPAKRNDADIETAPETEAEAFVPMEIPEIRVPHVVVPIKQTSLAYGNARELLNSFETAAGDLTATYRSNQDNYEKDVLDLRTFADRLDALAVRWRGLSDGMLQRSRYTDAPLTSLRAALLSVVIYQRVFLTGYAQGLRDKDQARIERAFKDLEHSNEALVHARQYVN